MVDKEMISAISDLLDVKLEEKLKPVNARLDRVEGGIIRLEKRVMKLEQATDRLEKRVTKLEQATDRLEKRVTKLEQTTDRLEKRVTKLEQATDRLEQETTRLSQETTRLSQETTRLSQETTRLSQETTQLSEQMRYVRVVQLENNVIPRLNTIESCYLDTSKRYLEQIDQVESMQSDMEVLKVTVEQHSEKLQMIS